MNVVILRNISAALIKDNKALDVLEEKNGITIVLKCQIFGTVQQNINQMKIS